MIAVKTQLFRAGLSGLWYSGAARALSCWTAGRGAVLMLHRCRPESRAAFSPNRALAITPEYLECLIASFRAEGVDIVSLDEALRRLPSRRRMRRFVCFTFDDGYRDNLEHALPIFLRHGAPFTVYATVRFADRTLAPWWEALEHLIARAPEIRWDDDEHSCVYSTRSVSAKQLAYRAVAARLLALPAERVAQQLSKLVQAQGLSMRALAQRDMCGWSELRSLRAAGVELGCHTLSHACLSRETAEVVWRELQLSRSRLEAELGCAVRHLAYPYGKREHAGARELAIARELGFRSAVTTRKGALWRAHARERMSLPRVEVTPSFERSPHYMQTILTGLPLIAWNRGRRVVTL